ncbi:MAG TPA: hypothetical protein VIE36_21550 [Methylomirabilota bacterium]|jgi:hypothetical protein
MQRRLWPLICLVAGILAGCAHSDKQWMKVNERYTTAEFRQDHAACSKGGTLDEACMRARGWVDVKPSAGDRAADAPPPPPAPQDYRWRR